MNKIRTAVIPAGGYGTRFLPASKSIPKEMFPVWNLPVIFHVVEEVVKSGITNIIFVVAHQKHSIEEFFSPNPELEEYLVFKGKGKKTEILKKITEMADFSFVYTKPPYGNGAPILAVQHLIDGESFVLVWGDEFVINRGKPRIKQCIEAFEKYDKPVISAFEIKEREKRQLYGMIDFKKFDKDETILEILKIEEKPKRGKEPSPFAAHGAYVLPADVFDVVHNIQPGKDNEIWLTDIINALSKKNGLLAKVIKDADYLDCGNPLQYLLSQIDYALKRSECSKEVSEYVKKIGFC